MATYRRSFHSYQFCFFLRQLLKISNMVHVVNCAVIGDTGIGKSDLIQAFVYGITQSDSPSSLGARCHNTNINSDGVEIEMNIWDLPGSTGLEKLTRDRLYNMDGIILAYDCRSLDSVHSLRSRWIPLLASSTPNHSRPALIIAGLHADEAHGVLLPVLASSRASVVSSGSQSSAPTTPTLATVDAAISIAGTDAPHFTIGSANLSDPFHRIAALGLQRAGARVPPVPLSALSRAHPPLAGVLAEADRAAAAASAVTLAWTAPPGSPSRPFATTVTTHPSVNADVTNAAAGASPTHPARSAQAPALPLPPTECSTYAPSLTALLPHSSPHSTALPQPPTAPPANRGRPVPGTRRHAARDVYEVFGTTAPSDAPLTVWGTAGSGGALAGIVPPSEEEDEAARGVLVAALFAAPRGASWAAARAATTAGATRLWISAQPPGCAARRLERDAAAAPVHDAPQSVDPRSLLVVDVVGSHDHVALFERAIAAGEPTVVKWAIAAGLAHSDFESGLSPLHYAAYVGNVDALQALLECGVPPDSVDAALGNTTAHYAALSRGDATRVFIELAHAGADLGAKNFAGETPTDLLREAGMDEAIRWVDQLRGAVPPPALPPVC